MNCTVADISSEYCQSKDDAGLNFVIGDLTKCLPVQKKHFKYYVVMILEVIEHIPETAYVVFNKLKIFSKKAEEHI